MDQVYDFLREFNFQTIISLAIIIKYLNKSIEDKLDKIDEDLKIMNTRISRVEGTVYGKEIYNHLENSK